MREATIYLFSLHVFPSIFLNILTSTIFKFSFVTLKYKLCLCLFLDIPFFFDYFFSFPGKITYMPTIVCGKLSGSWIMSSPPGRIHLTLSMQIKCGMALYSPFSQSWLRLVVVSARYFPTLGVPDPGAWSSTVPNWDSGRSQIKFCFFSTRRIPTY